VDAKTHHEHKHDSIATEAIHHAVHFDENEPVMPGGTADHHQMPPGTDADDEDDEHEEMAPADVTPLTEAEIAVYAQKVNIHSFTRCSFSFAFVAVN
jgi:hypothetical protein